jgi:thioredoxin-related protein
MKKTEMNKKLIVLVALLTTILSVKAQQPGIHFLDSLSWAQVKAKAKAENKYIFVDCFATWCGPCKYMAQNIFPQQKVGDYFNEHFVSITVQMDVTAADNQQVKAWYPDAKQLTDTYGIISFPTFLFFSPDGVAVHRIIGSSRNQDDFLLEVAKTFDPDEQYYTVIGQYKKHVGDSVFLKKALLLAGSLDDKSSENNIADCYLESVKNPYTKENMYLLANSTNSVSSKTFLFFYHQRKKINQVMGANFAESNAVFRVVLDKEIDPIVGDTSKSVNWKRISALLYRKYPIIAEKALIAEKEWYYSEVHFNKEEFEKAAVAYLGKFSGSMSNWEINELTWILFNKADSQAVLHKALSYSIKALADYPNTDMEFVDTYANLLYKTGKKDQALLWEKNAIAMAPQDRKADFEKTLKKMETNQVTWNPAIGSMGHF